jgi:ABC-2 type transport system ATP-binding protein
VLKMLTGLLLPAGGSAEICGLALDNPELKRIVGVLPESLALFDALTVGEHLELTGAVYGLNNYTTRLRTAQLLRVLRLEHGRDTLIHQCSYGMKKKTSLAMALLPNPRALFLDEPFAGLDPIATETMSVQLRACAQRGVTVVLTSHILSLVDRLADRVVMIHRGGVVLDSTIRDLPRSLVETYFERVETTAVQDLEWLGTASS